MSAAKIEPRAPRAVAAPAKPTGRRLCRARSGASCLGARVASEDTRGVGRSSKRAARRSRPLHVPVSTAAVRSWTMDLFSSTASPGGAQKSRPRRSSNHTYGRSSRALHAKASSRRGGRDRRSSSRPKSGAHAAAAHRTHTPDDPKSPRTPAAAALCNRRGPPPETAAV